MHQSRIERERREGITRREACRKEEDEAPASEVTLEAVLEPVQEPVRGGAEAAEAKEEAAPAAGAACFASACEATWKEEEQHRLSSAASAQCQHSTHPV